MGMDTPYWVDVPSANWQRHIRETSLSETGGWAGFQRHLAGLHGTQLDLKRPLWEIQLIHGLSDLPGLPANCQALALKVHHAAIDGMSMAAIIHGLHDESMDSVPATGGAASPLSEWDLWQRANLNFVGRQFKLVDTVKNLLPGLVRARESRKEFSDLPQ